MKINLLPSMFNQASSPIFNNQLKQKNPLGDVLKQMAAGLAEKSQGQDYLNEVEQKKLLINEFDTFTKTEEAEGSDGLDNEALLALAGIMKLGMHYINSDREKLNNFKQGINNFDTKIIQYENILNGKETLPDEYSMDSIKQMLAKTKNDRELYIADNGKSLKKNNWGNYIKDMSGFGSIVFPELKSIMGDLDLQFNPEASNVINEIDRVNSHLDQASEGIGKALKMIYKDLKKNGVHDAGYKVFRESNHPKINRTLQEKAEVDNIEDLMTLFQTKEEENRAEKDL